MKPYYEAKGVTIYNGDCREITASLSEVSAVVTDPPYELGFMGKSWDSKGISFQSETWRIIRKSCLSGSPLLSFGGSRTSHRIACAIEDAGWEIRDTLMWVYGSGFPKSLDISKAIDKVNGEDGRLLKFVEWMRATGLKQAEINSVIGKADVGSHYLRRDQPAIPTKELWAKLRPICGNIPLWVDELVERIEAEREVIGKSQTNLTVYQNIGGANKSGEVNTTAPSTPEAQLWEGYGTGLKPAYEPIILGMNPLDGTFANNALKHGVAGLNIDECRVPTGDDLSGGTYGGIFSGTRDGDGNLCKALGSGNKGRFPANFIHDGSQQVMELFPDSKSTGGKGEASKGHGNDLYSGYLSRQNDSLGGFGDSGSAARFFYCAKASKAERNKGCEDLEEGSWATTNKFTSDVRMTHEQNRLPNKNSHPTVKPLALMEYLVKLVRYPEYNFILDPFCGSGTTLLACIRLGIPVIGIDSDESSCEIAAKRCNQELSEIKELL